MDGVHFLASCWAKKKDESEKTDRKSFVISYPGREAVFDDVEKKILMTMPYFFFFIIGC